MRLAKVKNSDASLSANGYCFGRVAPSGTLAERSESLEIGIASGLHPSQ